MTEAPTKQPWPVTLCLAGLVFGLIVVGVGVAWPTIVTPQMVWPAEKAEELKQAADAFHSAREQGRGAGESGAPSPRELAEERFNRLKNELETAQRVRGNWGHWVVAAGFGLTIASGFGYLALRGD